MPVMGAMRKDHWKVSVKVDDRDLGVFDVQTGGETDSDELKYKPGGMAPAVSLGGSVTVGQVIVSRNYRGDRDAQLVHWLLGRVGKGQVIVRKDHLDQDRNVFAAALVTQGVLKRVTPPEVDSTSTEAAVIEIEVTPAGTVT